MTPKLRSDSNLHNLTAEQRDELFDWIAAGASYRDAAKRSALPGPEGFGLPLQPTTIRRYYLRERASRHVEDLALAKTEDIIAINTDELLSEAKKQFAHSIYQTAVSPESTETLGALSRAFHRLEIVAHRNRSLAISEKRADLEGQRLQLDNARHLEQIRQFEFDIIHAIMKHALQLRDIAVTDGLTDLQKYQRARPLVFGSSPWSPPVPGAPVAVPPTDALTNHQ